MEDITTMIGTCRDAFVQTEEYRILKTYRTRDNRLTFDERFAINKSIECTYAPVFGLLRADAPSLTESDLFFCALTVSGIETFAIAECLSVTKDAIRMRKMRLREKLPSEWFETIFPEQKRNSFQSVTSHVSLEQAAPIPLPSVSTENAKVMKETMSFGKAVASCFSKYFTFNGRASRSEFWYFFLFNGLVKMTISVTGHVFDSCFLSSMSGELQASLTSAGTIIWWLVVVGFAVPRLSVTVRRLHDLDIPWWISIFIYILPLLFFILSHATTDNESTLYIFMYCMITSIVEIILFTRPGTEGPNTYGPDPVGIKSEKEFSSEHV